MILIRKAKVKDAETLADFAMDMMKLHRGYDPVFEMEKGAHSKFLEWFRKLPRNSRVLLLIAETEGQIAGYLKANLKTRPSIYKIRKMGFIHDLYISEKFRNRGIGKKLIHEAFAWFKQKGIKYADLMVAANNETARTVYKKMNFKGYMVEKHRKI